MKEGEFLLEYEYTKSYGRSERQKHEEEYWLNDEPCMVFEVETRAGWVCLDATRATHTPGRLMNHAAARVATAKPYKALMLEGKWRVGFIATSDLHKGQELTWDYGCSPDGQQWLMRRQPARSNEGVTASF